MITLNYQTFGKNGFNLRLRLYQNGETKFISVTKLLKGNPTRRQWNQKRQMFVPSAPYSEENNIMLMQFRKKYDEAIVSWKGSVYGLLAYLEEGDAKVSADAITLTGYISRIVEETKERKHADGTREVYEKLDRRLQDYCLRKKIRYRNLLLSDVTPKFVNGLFGWIKKDKGGKGYQYVSSMFHAVLMRADKEGLLDWKDFRNCDWKKKVKVSAKKYQTLSKEQCERFVNLKSYELPRHPDSELFKDFCTFILFTGQSCCDAVSLTRDDIQTIDGVDYFVFKRRKISDKQSVACSVPIGGTLRAIIDKYKWISRDGYIFPIRSKRKLVTQTTNNGDIKKLLSKLNYWLKEVGKRIGYEFPLHTYTFRHTAITNYISKGIPIIYVANMMGTSVDNCEKIYYNNIGDTASRDKVMQVMGI